MNIYVYPNELSHYGVVGMRWGHRKARIEEKKARQRKYGAEHPIKSAVGQGFKTWGALMAAGFATAAVAGALLKGPAMSSGKLKTIGVLSKIGSLSIGVAQIAGIGAGVSQLARNQALAKSQNNSQ